MQNQKLKGFVDELTLELKKARKGEKKRAFYPVVEARNATFVEQICALKEDHPFLELSSNLGSSDLCEWIENQQEALLKYAY